MKHFKNNINKILLSTDIKDDWLVLLRKKKETTHGNFIRLGDPLQPNIIDNMRLNPHVHAIQELVPPIMNINSNGTDLPALASILEVANLK